MTTVLCMCSRPLAKLEGVSHFGHGFAFIRALWVIAGTVSLILFAAALTRVDAPAAGRLYAFYGGIYIVSSRLWLRAVERMKLDRADSVGAAICLVGAAAIPFGPRTP